MRNVEAYVDRLSAADQRRRADQLVGRGRRRDGRVHRHASHHVPGFRTLHFGDVVDRNLLDDERDNNTVIVEQLGEVLVSGFGLTPRPRLRVRAGDRGRDGRRAGQARLPARPGRRRAVLAEAKEASSADYLLPQRGSAHAGSDRLSAPLRGTPGRARRGRSGAPRSIASPRTRCSVSTCSHSSPGLGVAEPDPVAEAQRRPRRRRPAASAPRRRPPSAAGAARRQHRQRQPGRVGRAGGDPAAAVHGDQPGPGRRTTDVAKKAAGVGRQARYASNRRRAVEPGAGGQLGDRRVGGGQRRGCRCRRR